MPSVLRSSGTGSSEIEIIVVGCGFAGLACAIESKRKGHKVIVLEKRPSLESLGACALKQSATGLMAICTQHEFMYMHNFDGELLATQPLPQRLYGSNSYNGRRGEIHDVLLQYAKKLGADVRFNQNVETYWEDAERGRAGVIVNGERMEADVVVGADGARSRAREIVLGYEDKPIPSGYAIYRAWFNSREQGLDTDPLTSFFCKKGGEFYAWIGKDVHMLAMSFRDGEEMCWVLTHKDEHDIGESWSYPGKISDVLTYVKDWDPCCSALIRKAPFCVDWKLVQRDPLPTWVSKGGYTIVIGDAAHPFLPSWQSTSTSMQGASQGVEDGVTIATVLDLASKKNIPLATRTFEHIRYDRVRRAQALGESNRNRMHKDPESRDEDVSMPFPEWLLDFDAEKHARNLYDKVSGDILLSGYMRPSELAS
ncbi:hypothetical protein EW145_g3206 [Phellinidium pouzarii]|uniref:FAD-binding domain-containing protein n=1 Tax=Phellinidium pouzarii TaxID=167371 RepID=A0A4S4L8F1_9AGAM|nr:hypothetical protein EW145_g3206 [Phellinidium pouzarii]